MCVCVCVCVCVRVYVSICHFFGNLHLTKNRCNVKEGMGCEPISLSIISVQRN